MIIAAILIVSILAPWLSRWSPTEIDFAAFLTGPTASHLLGTDGNGMDIWSRIVHGARLDLGPGERLDQRFGQRQARGFDYHAAKIRYDTCLPPGQQVPQGILQIAALTAQWALLKELKKTGSVVEYLKTLPNAADMTTFYNQQGAAELKRIENEYGGSH